MLFQQFFIQRIGVISLVANNNLRGLGQETAVEGLLYERCLMRRSAFCPQGDRKTIFVTDAHDLCTLSAFSFTDARAPFFAGVKVPSIKPSDRSIPPRSSRSRARACSAFSKTPDWFQCWKRRWQVALGGYRSGISFQGAPVLSTHKMPLSTSRLGLLGLPPFAPITSSGGKSGETIAHCSFVKSIGSAPHHNRRNRLLNYEMRF